MVGLESLLVMVSALAEFRGMQSIVLRLFDKSDTLYMCRQLKVCIL